ncbi:MAG: hypothetical protein ABW101_19270 [Candidatus Thiodiazotropha sp.]
MGMLSSIGGMACGIVGGMFGGPLGAQLGSQIGGGIGNMLEGLISQHGQSNVQGAMNNNMLGSLVGQLGQAIQCHPGIPQFAKDEMCQALGSTQQSCPPEPTPPGCQRDTDDAMGGMIDKIVDKVVDMIMDKLMGGECKSGDFGDMLRDAVEEVVREQIGGGAESGGGCERNDVIRPGNEDMVYTGGADATASSAGGSNSSADNDSALDDLLYNNLQGQRECREKDEDGKDSGSGTSGNWLVALARALSDVQKKFLTAAMENVDTMKANADATTQGDSSETGGADQAGGAEQGKDGGAVEGNKEGGSVAEDTKKSRDAFVQAQSEYSANMQMFNMMATMTSTSLKTLGEGLAGIARKQ